MSTVSHLKGQCPKFHQAATRADRFSRLAHSMPNPPHLETSISARFTLRAATAQAHERLDNLYAGFDLSNAEDYRRFLLGHAPAFLPVEQALAEAGAGDLISGWSNRRRESALLSDLAALGLAVPQSQTRPEFVSEAQILGGAYVLEGSRLGGTVLSRTVGAGLPATFLSPGNSADWRAFITTLDERLSSERSLADAAASALDVFALFERAVRTQLRATRT